MIKSLMVAALPLSLALAGLAHAQSELDQGPVLPKQLVVKTNEKTGQESVFKVDAPKVTSDSEARIVAAKASDEIIVKAGTELDQGTSTEAWYRWRGGYGGYGGYGPYNYPYNYYSYNYYGYNYAYYPCYNYAWGGYRYSYYWYY